MTKKTEKFINQKSQNLVNNAVLEADRLRSSNNYDGMKHNLMSLLSKGGMETKIYLYGSRVIGLAHKESDLDIYIEYGMIIHNSLISKIQILKSFSNR